MDVQADEVSELELFHARILQSLEEIGTPEQMAQWRNELYRGLTVQDYTNIEEVRQWHASIIRQQSRKIVGKKSCLQDWNLARAARHEVAQSGYVPEYVESINMFQRWVIKVGPEVAFT